MHWTIAQLPAYARAGFVMSTTAPLASCTYAVPAYYKGSAMLFQQWSAFLAARSSVSIVELKLTADASVSREVQALVEHKHMSPLAHVPLACHTLMIDEHFAPCIVHYTERLAKVHNMAINYGESRGLNAYAHCKDPLAVMPSLVDLPDLKILKVEVPDSCNNALADCLAKCPQTLESCYVGAWGDHGLHIQLQQQLVHQTLDEHLSKLSKLELCLCKIHGEDDAITCLQRLTNLSIVRSELGECMTQVTKLTNLHCL